MCAPNPVGELIHSLLFAPVFRHVAFRPMPDRVCGVETLRDPVANGVPAGLTDGAACLGQPLRKPDGVTAVLQGIERSPSFSVFGPGSGGFEGVGASRREGSACESG